VLDAYNQVQNFALGLVNKPELMLAPGIKYTDKEIARRKGLLWNGQDLDWYVEHGHSVTERAQRTSGNRPWRACGCTSTSRTCCCSVTSCARRWTPPMCRSATNGPSTTTRRCPRPLDPVHEEPPQYDLYGMFYKDIQLNFGESPPGNPMDPGTSSTATRCTSR